MVYPHPNFRLEAPKLHGKKGRNTMRRIISIALAVLMLLSVATVGVFTVSAEDTGSKIPADAIAVNDATDFSMISGDGAYYLAADITLDSTNSSKFSGTLYGNGHKLTVTSPVFENLDGATIKDLVLAGEIIDEEETALNVGVLAKAAGDVVIENVVNNATLTAKKSHVAGLLGFVRSGTNVTLKNCTNTAELKGGQVGGLIAESLADRTLVENCMNTGALTSVTDTTVGGIVATVTSEDGSFEANGCVNTGDLNGRRPGGIIGVSENIRYAVLTSCVNTGYIVSPTNSH